MNKKNVNKKQLLSMLKKHRAPKQVKFQGYTYELTHGKYVCTILDMDLFKELDRYPGLYYTDEKNIEVFDDK